MASGKRVRSFFTGVSGVANIKWGGGISGQWHRGKGPNLKCIWVAIFLFYFIKLVTRLSEIFFQTSA